MAMDSAKIFGQVLRDLRDQRDLSQARLAELTGLDRTYISLLERGLRQPTLGTLLVLAKALDVSLVSMAKAIEAQVMHDRK